jgi:hypothetical protein
VASPELRRQTEAQEKQLQDEFEKHTCDKDACQAAARIVREATEDR